MASNASGLTSHTRSSYKYRVNSLHINVTNRFWMYIEILFNTYICGFQPHLFKAKLHFYIYDRNTSVNLILVIHADSIDFYFTFITVNI